MRKFLILLSILLWPFLCLATTATELEATPSAITKILGGNSRLIISEVSFKNRTADWVELYFYSGSPTPVNLKGIFFADDNTFKTLPDFYAIPGQYILLTFKNNQADATPYINTTRTGLTATTEQFIIFDSDKTVIDAVCWSNQTPTTSEQADMVKLFNNDGWNSSYTADCINSDNIKTDQTIIRTSLLDTDSSDDWSISASPSPLGINLATVAETTATTEQTVETAPSIQPQTEEDSSVPTSPVVDILPPAETPAPLPLSTTASISKVVTPVATTAKTTASKSKSSAKTTSSTKKYKNGDLSDSIIVSEFLPNPEGTDKGNEWIELQNNSDEDVNLGNWSLDDIEGGSKPYFLPDKTIIKPGSTIIIKDADSKLALGNTGDSVRLFNFEDELVDEISYDESPSGQSYSKFEIISMDGEIADKWLWQATPTPAENNPALMELTAEIVKPPTPNDPYHFETKDKDGNIIAITFGENVLAAPLAIATLTQGTEIKFIAKIISDGKDDKADKLELISYEILTPSPASDNNSFLFPSIAGSLLIAAGCTIYFLRKKNKGI